MKIISYTTKASLVCVLTRTDFIADINKNIEFSLQYRVYIIAKYIVIDIWA